MTIRPTRLCEDCKNGTELENYKGYFSCQAIASPAEQPPSHCLFYSGPRWPVDVVVITAVGVEQRAAIAELHPDGADAWDTRTPASDGPWQICQFHLPLLPGTCVGIALGKTRCMGLAAAASLTATAIQIFRPSFVVMIGIAAGLKSETSIGDIIVPKRVWDYGAGKWVAERGKPRFRARPDPIPLDEDIRHFCDTLGENAEVCERIFKLPSDFPSGFRRPKVQIESMVSGAAVVNTSKIWNDIRDINDTVVALDMESYGVALSTLLASSGGYRPQWLVAKAVCDYGQRKNNRFQELAARVSARFLREYIQQSFSSSRRMFSPIRYQIPEME